MGPSWDPNERATLRIRRNRLMYLLKSHEMVFLAQPRTGSRAVAQALSAQHGFVQVGTHHGVWPEDDPPSPDMIIISAGAR